MSVVRRGAVGAVVAGLVLLGGPVWAQQEDPCAPGPDGSVPEMCQSGPSEPTSDTGTVGMEPEDPCAGARPVEPGDGVVTGDPGEQGVVEGEPEPDREPRPAPDTATTDGPGAVGDDGIVCAFGVPVSSPGEEPVLESTAGGGTVTAARQLPRTGAYDRVAALTALGAGLVLAGAGVAAAGRRRQV